MHREIHNRQPKKTKGLWERKINDCGRGKGEKPKANYPCCNTICTPLLLLLLTPSSRSICNPFYRFLPTSSLTRKGGKKIL
jgi:hypothetical protein